MVKRMVKSIGTDIAVARRPVKSAMALCAVLTAGIAIGNIGEAAPPGAQRSYTVDDFLKLEDTGAAAADPSGHWIVWEQAPPYDQLGDYGIGAGGTWQGGGFRLMAVDLTAGTTGLLFPPEAGTAYFLGGFSPSGRFLTFVSVREGHAHLGMYDFESKVARELDASPLLSSGYYEQESVWISDDLLVFAAYPQGAGPWLLEFRRRIGDRLSAAWQTSWKGKVASVEVADSHTANASIPLPGRLLAINARTGAMRELASGQFQSVSVSQDHRYLAALQQWSQGQPVPGKPNDDWVLNRSRLVMLDLSADRPAKVFADGLDVFPGALEWAPHANQLGFFAWGAGEGARSGKFHVLDAGTGSISTVPHDGLDLASERERSGAQRPERAVWLDGKLAVFARRNPPGDSSSRFTYRNRKVLSSDAAAADRNAVAPQWFLLDSNGTHVSLSDGLDDVSAVPLYSDGTSLVVLAHGKIWRLRPGRAHELLEKSVPGEIMFLGGALTTPTNRPRFSADVSLLSHTVAGESAIMLNVQSGALISLATKPGSVPMASSPSARALLLRNGAGKNAEILLQKVHSGSRVLYRLNRHLDNVAETRWQSFKYKSSGQSARDDREGCLLLPSDYVPGRKYPMIVEVYPNRGGACDSPALSSWFKMGTAPGPYSEHLLAARGFIVFHPDTIRRTLDAAPLDGPLAHMPEFVDPGIDAVVAAGYADATRLGLMGFSQGGFASLWLASQSKRYGAVVSLNGWSDMYSEALEARLENELVPQEMPYTGFVDGYVVSAGTDMHIGKTPWEDPEKYVRNSPLFTAPSISSPLLLIHTDMDGFRAQQYEMMFTALYRHRKEAELRIYLGEGHGPSSPANIRDMWERVFYWFDTYLQVERDTDHNLVFDGDRLHGRADH